MGAHEEVWVRQSHCEETSGRILESQEKLHGKLDSIEKRLFRDNGSVSIQTRIDRHGQILRVLLWVVGIIAGTFLAGCTTGILLLVRELLVRGAAA